jgi:hypothetical protein
LVYLILNLEYSSAEEELSLTGKFEKLGVVLKACNKQISGFKNALYSMLESIAKDTSKDKTKNYADISKVVSEIYKGNVKKDDKKVHIIDIR